MDAVVNELYVPVVAVVNELYVPVDAVVLVFLLKHPLIFIPSPAHLNILQINPVHSLKSHNIT